MNFMFALMYNVLAIPFAAGVWFPYTHMQVPPQYAGLSMAMSSITVVVSSMSLRFYQRPAILCPDDTDGEDVTEVGVMGMARRSGAMSSIKRRFDGWGGAWLRQYCSSKRAVSGGPRYQALMTEEGIGSNSKSHSMGHSRSHSKSHSHSKMSSWAAIDEHQSV